MGTEAVHLLMRISYTANGIKQQMWCSVVLDNDFAVNYEEADCFLCVPYYLVRLHIWGSL